MSWESFHRRSEVLRRVSEEANRRRDGRLPTDVPGVYERFVGRGDLLATLQLRWYNHLSGAIELELSRQPSDLEGAVVAGWCRAADELPGVRMILDANLVGGSAQPVARQKEWELLAAAAGRAWGTEQCAFAEGRRIEDRARRGWVAASASQQSGGTARRWRSGVLLGRLHRRMRHDGDGGCGGDKDWQSRVP